MVCQMILQISFAIDPYTIIGLVLKFLPLFTKEIKSFQIFDYFSSITNQINRT
jgi:hypothetical protein